MKTIATLLLCCLSFIGFSQHNNVSLIYHWEDTTLVGSAQYDNVYNEVWGFERNGHEFAVIGSTFGTHIFDITDANNISEVARIAGGHQGPTIIHRDYHDYRDYLYAVADEGGNSTLQIFDISDLPNSISTVYDTNSVIRRAHNIFIDTASAMMYANGIADGNNNYHGFRAYSLANPLNPVLMNTYTGAGFTHDTYARNDTVFVNAGGNGLHILDFSNPTNPIQLGLITDYPFKGYNHSGWPSDDMKYYFLADENAGHKMKALDVSDFANITVLSTFFSDVDMDKSMPHNQIWKDGYLYVAHYHDGLQIFDVNDPSNPVKVGNYSTYPFMDHNVHYKGAWGVYPLLSSGKILVSDMQYGLFVLDASQAIGRDEQFASQFEAYPNPAKDFLNITLPEEWKVADMAIYSTDGKLVRTQVLSNQSTDLRLNLANGVYLIELSNNSERLVQKLVVNN